MASVPARVGATSAYEFLRQVEAAFHQYWGGQYEVVATFFGQPRPREELIAWLELQCYKEIKAVPQMARRLVELYDELDDTVERSRYEAEAYELADEVQHYRVLADVLELLTGQRRPARDFRPTAEQSKLEALRREGKTLGELGEALVGFAPGGGVAAFGAGMRIAGGPIERQLAKACQVIYEQELHHYRESRLIFDGLVRRSDPAVFEPLLPYARALAREHFLLRNAAFSFPLATERIAEIDAGHVEPFVPPL